MQKLSGCVNDLVSRTCFSYQLAVDVQIPKCLGGVEGEVVYIDTENSFNTNRLKQIAEATADHCTKVAGTAGKYLHLQNYPLY